MNLLLFNQFKVLETLQNKENRLVLKTQDALTNSFFIHKFHLQIWEEFGNREPDYIAEEISILLDMKGTPGIPEIVSYSKETQFVERIGNVKWLSLRFYTGEPNWNACVANLENTKKIWLPLAQTIHNLTRNHVIHRDIKPDNIVLNGETPVLLDFGVATYCEQNKILEEFLREDLFNLAKMLYFLITGHRVYRLREQDILKSVLLQSRFNSLAEEMLTMIMPPENYTLNTFKQQLEAISELI